jgi:hypothetical protein
MLLVMLVVYAVVMALMVYPVLRAAARGDGGSR